MSLLNDLISMFSGHPQAQPQTHQQPQTPSTPVGQPLSQSSMNSLSPQTKALAQIYNQNPQDPRVAHMDPATFGYQPDIGYNPNPNTDIPYSAHTPQLAQLGNQYTANPTAPQFTGPNAVDPGLFGYPADGASGVNPNNVFRGGAQAQSLPQPASKYTVPTPPQFKGGFGQR